MISRNYYFIKKVSKLKKTILEKNDKSIYLKINFSYYFMIK